MTVPLSILDLAFVPEGASAGDALRNTFALAEFADRKSFKRFWLAEHHNMVGIASAATAVVIGQVAARTERIRVGAGGIMLPNHAPLIIAEQFGTLESLFPGRIDLGLGRAPGTDQRTVRALRRSWDAADTFPQDVLELQAYFEPAEPGQHVVAVPGAGLRVPIWILGSSLFGARLAAMLGLPYAFASHFAPRELHAALEVYRSEFRASSQSAQPYASAGVNVVLAESTEEARKIFTSAQQQFTNLIRGVPGRLPPPIDDIEAYWSPAEKAHAAGMLTYSFVGTPDKVRAGLEQFIADTSIDELIVVSAIYDHQARLRSYELLADLMEPDS